MQPDASIQKYLQPLQPLPQRLEQALAAGVHARPLPAVRDAALVLTDAKWGDGVYRAPDGRVLVICTTDMPGVRPHMVDWWFHWHLHSDERYRLWHPHAHVSCRVRPQPGWPADPAGSCIGQIADVDEYIGPRLRHLSIAFQPPRAFGLAHLRAQGWAAICGYTSDRHLASQGGSLVHLVEPQIGGSRMRSGFWLGDIRSHLPVVGPAVDVCVNRRWTRSVFMSDTMMLDLLRHCAEEMHHLARFLPALYAEKEGAEEEEAAGSAIDLAALALCGPLTTPV